MVETADATAVAATEAATAEEVKEVAETWAGLEATVDWGVTMAGAATMEAKAAKAAKAAVSAARAETAAASAASATKTAAAILEAAKAADTQCARRRSRRSRCPEGRPCTPNQGRHPHRCRCWR